MKKSLTTKKVLLTGGTGLLGTHIIRNLPSNVELYATVHQYRQVLDHPNVKYLDLDVTDAVAVAKTMKEMRPDFVIHTAAHSQVDFCENNQTEAQKTNVESTIQFVDEANKISARILFCSSNMVFDGLKAPYAEGNSPHPQTFYGKTKVLSEKYIQQHASHFTIFRLMTMYGWNWQPQRKNMVSMSIEKLRANQELWMTNDVFNNMLYVDQAAKTFWASIFSDEADKQVFHLAGSDCVNRFQTTQKLCDVFELDSKLVHEVSSDYFKGKEASRAPNSCFKTSKAQHNLQFTSLSLVDGFTLMKQDESTHETRQKSV